MHRGLYRYIDIKRKVRLGVTSGALGSTPNEVWQTWKSPFCDVETRRGREHFDPTSQKRFSETVWIFRVVRDEVIGLDPVMKVTFEGQDLNIKAIRDDPQTEEACVIECTLQDGYVGSQALLGYIEDAIADGESGSVYAGFTVLASGGTAPYTFSVSAGALPAGLSLNPSTGAVAGTPTETGTFSATFAVTDAAGETEPLPGISFEVT